MIRRLLITFILVLVLGLLAFYGVSYFTKEEPLNEIPFSSSSHLDTSKSSSSLPSESTSSTPLEVNKSTEAGKSNVTAEKPSEPSSSSTGALSRSVTPPRSTETTSSGVSGMSSESPKETTKPSVERETPGTTGSSHLAESSKHPAESTPGTSSAPSFAKASESGRKDRMESGRKERTEESSSSGRKDRTQETTTGSRKRSETSVSENESPSVYRKRTGGSMTSSSREMLRLNVVSIGYFRTEEEARSVAPYLARNAGLSDYMITKAIDKDYYTIQVGAYVNKEEADRLVDRLSQQRFPVRLESKVVPLSALNKNRVDYQRY